MTYSVAAAPGLRDDCLVVPELDANRVRKWAMEQTPPEFADQMRVEVDENQRGITIFECRPPSGVGGNSDWIRMAIARLTYVKVRNEWTLYWADSNDRFLRYPELDPTPHVSNLLAEIDQDKWCLFWG